MKELSIEQKAKRYDEVSEEVKDFFEGRQKMYSDVNQTLEYLFPELRESEDERIIQWIKKELEAKYVTDNIVNNEMADKALAWLEKQGDTNKEYWRGYREGKQEILDKYAELEKQGEQKPAAKYKVGDTVYYNSFGSEDESIISDLLDYFDEDKCLKHEVNDIVKWLKTIKPQQKGWSENETKMLNNLITYLNGRKDLLEEIKCTYISWLKSLKDRIQPQPKQEWSEEDGIRLQRIIDFLWYNRKGDTDTIYQQEQDIEWLKSLRPQSHWKPSDEQMKALDIAIRCGILLGSWEEEALKSLIEQLKKLREE